MKQRKDGEGKEKRKEKKKKRKRKNKYQAVEKSGKEPPRGKRNLVLKKTRHSI